MTAPQSTLHQGLKFRSPVFAAKHDVQRLVFREPAGCPRLLACLKLLEPSLVYEGAEMMVNPSEQAIGPNAPGVAGAINVSSPPAERLRKAQVRRLRPIAGSA
jgi:hypothetical protein